jgi:GDPmannose 4,6-dehydratase
MKKALITGITGQDGNHLTKFLLSKDYEVHGIVNGQRNPGGESFIERFPKAELHQGDLADFSSLQRIISEVKPDEIYNLGAISFVALSFTQPEMTANITGLGTLRLLEAAKQAGLQESVKFYQASSSEMFGKVRETPQNEATPFHPRSPYGVAKTFAHYTCVNYREAYRMFVSSGILFNHEGEYRGYEFVTRKITSNVARIKLGKQKRFSLGNLDSLRDWGYAGDYVEAMWLMLQQPTSEDFVIATGKNYSVKDFLRKALVAAELDDDLEKYVDFDKTLLRPSEVDLLVGDPRKAQEVLGWSAKTNLDELIYIMIENDLRIESEKH